MRRWVGLGLFAVAMLSVGLACSEGEQEIQSTSPALTPSASGHATETPRGSATPAGGPSVPATSTATQPSLVSPSAVPSVAPTSAPTAVPTPIPTAPPTPQARTIDVTLDDFFISPDNYVIHTGEDVTFKIKNDGATLHNMHIASNVVTQLGPHDAKYASALCTGADDPCSEPHSIVAGGSGSLTFGALSKVGLLEFRCDFHPATMVAVIMLE